MRFLGGAGILAANPAAVRRKTRRALYQHLRAPSIAMHHRSVALAYGRTCNAHACRCLAGAALAVGKACTGLTHCAAGVVQASISVAHAYSCVAHACVALACALPCAPNNNAAQVGGVAGLMRGGLGGFGRFAAGLGKAATQLAAQVFQPLRAARHLHQCVAL